MLHAINHSWLNYLWKIVSPSLSVILTVNWTIELSNLWLLSYGWRMYLWVEGPAPAYSAKFTSTKPSLRKWRPPFSSCYIDNVLHINITAQYEWLIFHFVINLKIDLKIELTILIDMRHLQVSRIPELALAFILQGNENRAEYLTQWFWTSILKLWMIQ